MSRTVSPSKVSRCAVDELFDGVERMRNHLVAEFCAQSGNRNSRVQAKAEEPCLLVLALGRKPRGFGRLGGIQIAI